MCARREICPSLSPRILLCCNVIRTGISSSHLTEARVSQLLILIVVDDTDDVTLSRDTLQDVTPGHVTPRDTLTELSRKYPLDSAAIKHK